jgi:hypothetical protein
MRTTITLDRDVAEMTKAVVAKSGQPFKKVVNEALRRGLEELRQPAAKKPYRTRPHAMGLRPGINIDNVQELLAQVEGDNAR